MKPDDLCPRPSEPPPTVTRPLAAPLYLSTVYRCDTPEQASAILAGDEAGYVYSRDGHPNADLLAEKCRQLHGAERAVITSSGMAALALAVVSQLGQGDQIVVSRQLYGRTHLLLGNEAARLGFPSVLVDTSDLSAVASAMTSMTRLIVVETITNPLLGVSDIAGLAELAHRAGAKLLVDNTLAGPVVCRPTEHGADLVVESLTKSMNGHSDVLLGLLCGRAADWSRVPQTRSTWGWSSSPFDCWLAARGLETFALRSERANANALAVAQHLMTGPRPLEAVHYPGLPNHPDRELACRQFGGRFGSLVSFTLSGGRPSAEAFMAAAHSIPFCPSLGETSTTLTHPASTSHRAMIPEARSRQGIHEGTIRLSVGIESSETIIDWLDQALAAVR